MADKIIIFSGKQYSGKDTAAKILMEGLNGYKRCAMGDIIKLTYAKEKGLTYDEIEANKAKYRADLIELGNWGRQQDPDYWLKKILEEDGNIIVTDVRVPHEYEIFKNAGAVSIRIEASREVRAQRGTLVGEDDITETGLDDVEDWNYIVPNDSDYNTLRARILNIARQIRRGKIKKHKVYKNCKITYTPQPPTPRKVQSLVKCTIRDLLIGAAGLLILYLAFHLGTIRMPSYMNPSYMINSMIFMSGIIISYYLIVNFIIRLIFKTKEKNLEVLYDRFNKQVIVNGQIHDIKKCKQYVITLSDALNVFTMYDGTKLKLYETDGHNKNLFNFTENTIRANILFYLLFHLSLLGALYFAAYITTEIFTL